MRRSTENTEFLVGVFMILPLGGLGGYLLTGGPFSGIGAFFGTIFAAPLGVCFALACDCGRLPAWIVCLGQFGGAVGVGVIMLADFRRTGNMLWPLSGQLLGGLLAVLVALPLSRHRRIPLGHCQQCGYNLTGNVSGVCPECGRPR